MKELFLSDFRVKYPEGKHGLFGSVNNTSEVQKLVDQQTTMWVDTCVSLESAQANLKAALASQASTQATQSSSPSRPQQRWLDAIAQVIPKIQEQVQLYQAIADKKTKAAADLIAAQNPTVSPDPLNTAAGASQTTTQPTGAAAIASTAVQTTQAAVATGTGFFHTHKNAVIIGAVLLAAGGVIIYVIKKKA